MASARRWLWYSDSHRFQLDRRSEETSSSQRPRCTDPGALLPWESRFYCGSSVVPVMTRNSKRRSQSNRARPLMPLVAQSCMWQHLKDLPSMCENCWKVDQIQMLEKLGRRTVSDSSPKTCMLNDVSRWCLPTKIAKNLLGLQPSAGLLA